MLYAGARGRVRGKVELPVVMDPFQSLEGRIGDGHGSALAKGVPILSSVTQMGSHKPRLAHI